MVIGRDSHSKGCGFKSRHHMLDGHFFTYYCCKNCNVCLKRSKINEKEAGVGPFKQNHNLEQCCITDCIGIDRLCSKQRREQGWFIINIRIYL